MAIKLLIAVGYFADYLEQLPYYTKGDDDLTSFCKLAWFKQDYASLWRNTPEYFAEYLRYDGGDDVRRGIIEWEKYRDFEYKRNFHEDAAIVTDLTPSSSHEESDEESDEEYE